MMSVDQAVMAAVVRSLRRNDGSVGEGARDRSRPPFAARGRAERLAPVSGAHGKGLGSLAPGVPSNGHGTRCVI